MAIVSTNQALEWLGLAPGTVSAKDQSLVSILLPMAHRLVKRFVGYEVEQNTYTEYYPQNSYRPAYDPLVTSYENIGGRIVSIEQYGDNRRVLQTFQVPIRQIASIWETPGAWDGGPPPNFTTQLTGKDFYVDWETYDLNSAIGLCWTGFVYRRTGIWTMMERCVQVTYLAGLTAAELDITSGIRPEFAQAILFATQAWFNQVKMQQPLQVAGNSPGAIVQEKIGDSQFQYDQQSQQLLYGMTQDLPLIAMKILEPVRRMGQYL